MSIRNLRLFVFAAALTGSAFAQSTTTRTSDFTFPLVGVGTTETLGVNLINLATTSATSAAAAPSCTGTVTFINAAGITIGTPTTFTLASKAVQVVTMTFAAAAFTGTRGLVRTVIETTRTSNIACSLSYSLNTYDTTTGVTHVFLSGASETPTASFGHN